MKHTLRCAFVALIMVLSFQCCKPIHEVITHHETITHYVDSVIRKDSICYIPVERYVDIVNQLDTLRLSTSLAEASAYLDTSMNLLKGEIHNKKGAQFQYITETETIYKDSIVYEEKPVPYEVEVVKTKNASWKVWLWAILASMGLLGMLYWHFKSKLINLFGCL